MTLQLAKDPVSDPIHLQGGEPIHRLTVAQYSRIVERGGFTADDKLVLLEGWLVEKMTSNPPHAHMIVRLTKQFNRLLSDDYSLLVQLPVELARSVPEPDLAVVRGEIDSYMGRHPGGADVVLVVEVADATLRSDQTTKQHIYADAGIPEYWIVNLVAHQIEMYTRPVRQMPLPFYERQAVYSVNDVLPLAIEGDVLALLPVAQLFGAAGQQG